MSFLMRKVIRRLSCPLTVSIRRSGRRNRFAQSNSYKLACIGTASLLAHCSRTMLEKAAFATNEQMTRGEAIPLRMLHANSNLSQRFPVRQHDNASFLHQGTLQTVCGTLYVERGNPSFFFTLYLLKRSSHLLSALYCPDRPGRQV